MMTQKTALIAEIIGQGGTDLTQSLRVSRRNALGKSVMTLGAPEAVDCILSGYHWQDLFTEKAWRRGASSDRLRGQATAQGIRA